MAIALIASSTIAAGGTSGPATTPAVDTTGATLLVVRVIGYGSAPSVTDSKGNAWTALTEGAAPDAGSGPQGCRIFYCSEPIVGAGHTFSAAGGGSLYPSVQASAWSGTDAGAYGGEAGGVTGTEGDLALTLGPVTPDADGSLVLLVVNLGDGSNLAIDDGFTSAFDPFSAGAKLGMGVGHLVQGTAGPVGPTVTFTDSAGDQHFVRPGRIAWFRPASGASPLSATAGAGSITTTGATLTAAGHNGTAPYSYQWTLDGEDLEGETAATLVLTGLAPDTLYDGYACDVSDAASATATASVSFSTLAEGPTYAEFAVDAAGISRSPYNWDASNAGRIEARNPGAEIQFKVSGTTKVQVGFDVSNLAGSADYPYIRYVVDRADDRAQLSGLTEWLTIADGLTTGEHAVIVMLDSIDWQDRRPVRFTGIRVDVGGSVYAADVPTSPAIGYGDSQTEAQEVLGAGVSCEHESGWHCYARGLAHARGARVGMVGYSGSGWGGLQTTWSEVRPGLSRLSAGKFSPMPAYVSILLGQNDSGGSGLIASVTATLQAIRAACDADTPILVCPSANGANRSGVEAGVAAVDDPHTHLISVSLPESTAGAYTTNHLSISGHAMVGAQIAALAAAAEGGGGPELPTGEELATAVWNFANRSLTS